MPFVSVLLLRKALVCFLTAALLTPWVHAQLSTQDHLDEPGFWPTRPGVSRRAALTAEHPGKACPVAKHDCASCHMPKVYVKEMHDNFTDHRIRIARAGEPFPE